MARKWQASIYFVEFPTVEIPDNYREKKTKQFGKCFISPLNAYQVQIKDTNHPFPIVPVFKVLKALWGPALGPQNSSSKRSWGAVGTQYPCWKHEASQACPAKDDPNTLTAEGNCLLTECCASELLQQTLGGVLQGWVKGNLQRQENLPSKEEGGKEEGDHKH